jgi:hypothetical protein
LGELVWIKATQYFLYESSLEFSTKFLTLSLLNTLLEIDRVLCLANLACRSEFLDMPVCDITLGESALEVRAVNEGILGAANAPTHSDITKRPDPSLYEFTEELVFSFSVDAGGK